MIIERVDIINFKKYAHEKIIFGNKVIGIFGCNGAGKSTIFDAICWCLYGVTPTIGKEGQNVRQDELIRDGQEDMGVEVCFTYQNQIFNVHRYFSKASGIKASVRVNNEPMANSSKEVSYFITAALGLDAKAFISASFIRQNEIDLLTSQRASKRKDIINRLFNLQLYDQFLSDAKDEKKRLAQDSIRLEEEIKAQRSEIEQYQGMVSDSKQLSEAIRTISKDISSLEDSLSKCILERDESARKYEELLSHKQEKSVLGARGLELRNQLDEKKATLRRIDEAKEELHDYESELSSLGSLRNELKIQSDIRDSFLKLQILRNETESALSNANERYMDSKSKLEKEKKDLQNSRDILEIEYNSTIKQLSDLKENLPILDDLKASLSRTRDEVKKIEERISNEDKELVRSHTLMDKIENEKITLESISGETKCPTCKQALPDSLKSDLKKKNLQESVSLNRKMNKIKNKLKKLQELRSEKIKITGSLEENISNAHQLEKEISKLKASAEHLEKALKTRSEQIVEVELEADKLEATVKDSISLIKRKIDAYREKIDNLKFDERAYESLREKIEDHESIIRQCEKLANLIETEEFVRKGIKLSETRIKEIATKIDLHEEALKGLGPVGSRLRGLEKEIEDKRGQITELKVKEGKISQLAKSNDVLSNKIQDSILRTNEAESELKHITNEIHNYEVLMNAFKNIPINIHERLKPMIQKEVSGLLNSITQGKYPGVIIDEEYTLQISYNGAHYPIYRFSGGEKDLINLCLRIGISRVLVALSKEQGFSHIESLFLDETFSSFDNERRMNLLSVLNKLEGFFSQIIIITHVEEIKELIPNTMSIEENDDGSAVIRYINA